MRLKNNRPWLFTICLLAQLCLFCSNPQEEEDGIAIGLLLPYTGVASVNGSTFERAVIMLVDEINEAGGIAGKPVQLVFGDSHSDPQRSLESLQAMLDKNIVAMIGPENADEAKVLLPVLAQHKIVCITPYIGASIEVPLESGYPWVRLAPTAQSMGEALARELVAQNKNQVTVVAGDDSYSQGFAEAVTKRLTTLGVTVLTSATIATASFDYTDTINTLYQHDLQVLVLAAEPTVGARFVNDISVAYPNETRQWFFSPSLKTEVFIQNADVKEIEGSSGVAPQLPAQEDFSVAYQAEWNGEIPLEGIYFYYDAIALLAMALETAASRNPGAPTLAFEDLRDAVKAVAFPQGLLTDWRGVVAALPQIRQGSSYYYAGLTGPLLLNDAGDRQLGEAATWSIESGHIH